MKIRCPKNRFDLSVKRGDKVLEIGGGHNPHPRSNVVVDKYDVDNAHRCGDLKILEKQQFLVADGENLPFKDKEFDYVICCHVLEHVENPTKFLREQFRVAKRGYIETPSLLGEYIMPKESHKWILHEMNDVLYLVDKSKIGFNISYDLCELIQDYLPKHSLGYKIMQRTHPNLETIRIEWETDFEFQVEPTNPEILQFFKEKWKLAWKDGFFPERSMGKEFLIAFGAILDISKSVFKSKVLKR